MIGGHATLLVLSLMTVASASVAQSSEALSQPECFDALVTGKALKQSPTVFPDCGGDCIVMSWPWIVDVDVRRVLQGHAPTGHITVLTVQHTDRRTNRSTRWWLRRNTLGVFNALGVDDENRLPRCASDAAPAEPYVRPTKGQTLEDLRRQGEQQ